MEKSPRLNRKTDKVDPRIRDTDRILVRPAVHDGEEEIKRETEPLQQKRGEARKKREKEKERSQKRRQSRSSHSQHQCVRRRLCPGQHVKIVGAPPVMQHHSSSSRWQYRFQYIILYPIRIYIHYYRTIQRHAFRPCSFIPRVLRCSYQVRRPPKADRQTLKASNKACIHSNPKTPPVPNPKPS